MATVMLEMCFFKPESSCWAVSSFPSACSALFRMAAWSALASSRVSDQQLSFCLVQPEPSDISSPTQIVHFVVQLDSSLSWLKLTWYGSQIPAKQNLGGQVSKLLQAIFLTLGG